MQRLFEALAKTDDGAFIIDANHRVIFWNQAAERILGYPAEEAVGRYCYEILGGRDEQGRTLCQRYCLITIQAARGDSLPNQEVLARTKSGGNQWLNVTTFAYPVADNTIGRVIVHLFRDVTAEKEVQQFADRVLAASERLQGNHAGGAVPPTASQGHDVDLTAREWQVLTLMAKGMGTDAIAADLTISASTVRNHVQNVLGKLGVHSRLEAVAHAYQYGLIQIDEP